MTETEPTQTDPEALPQISCEEAFALTRTFTTRELSMSRTRTLRSHLSACPECMSVYREAVATAAALGRSHQERREQRAIERELFQLHAKAFGDRSTGEAKPVRKDKHRYFRLRLILIPAILIYIMTRITGFGPAPAKVLLVESRGSVSIAERTVDPEADPALVLPGRWVRTERFAQAKLDGRKCIVDLESSTDLLVESAAPPRFRLRSGGMRLEGSTKVVTILGLITVEEGKGRIAVDDRGVTIQPETGSWSCFDSGGEKVLENGREVLLEPAFGGGR
jgi:hypothetical protein